MNVWQKLAWLEWSRSFRLTGKDNHDFFWLTLFLILTLTLALLLWGTREGLLNRFIEVSLGHIEGVGIPIWVTANNAEGVDRSLLQQSPIRFYPYREVERYEVALPGQTIWDEKMPFEGWAVSRQDPLWQLGTSPTKASSSPPLEIILNQNLFKQYFDCATYVTRVQQQHPFWSPPTFSSKENTLGCLAGQPLWLEVQVGSGQRELLPFKIHWQSRIPTMHQLAFLFPLSTLHALKVANYFTHLKYYPETQIDKSFRIQELMIWAETLDRNILNSLESCLQVTIQANRIRFRNPRPRQQVIECIDQSGLVLQEKDEKLSWPYMTLTEAVESHYFQYEDHDYLTISCGPTQPRCQPCEQVIQSAAWRSLDQTTCTETQTTADMIALIGPYQKAITYVETRQQLASTLAQIEQLSQSATDARPAFYIHPTYHDAHVRFLFIQQIIEMLKSIYSSFFLVFLVILLMVQIGIVITHRQHQYGIFLSKGFSWVQLYQLVLMQMGLSFTVALGFAVLMIQWMRTHLSWAFAEIMAQKPYIDHILVRDFNLLPIPLLDHLIVSLTIGLIFFLMASLIFRQIVPPKQVEPAYLFKL